MCCGRTPARTEARLATTKQEHEPAVGADGRMCGATALVAVGEAQFQDDEGPLYPFDGAVGARVEEWVEENLSGYLAESTTRQYSGVYGKWRAWARRQGWMTEHLDKAMPTEENEDKLLGFLGYLGWLGCSVATLKQAVFAAKDARKRAGKGDPTERMYRLWMLLGTLEKRSGAMLKWIGSFVQHLSGDAADFFDAVMLNAAVQTAWFFMLRAKEYCDSNGVDLMMILRGADLKFVFSEGAEPVIIGVTLQFRKTKVDQEAFGECKTFYVSGVPEVCVVTALKKLQAVAPQRFSSGCEALKPLFRWSSGQVLKRTQVAERAPEGCRGLWTPSRKVHVPLLVGRQLCSRPPARSSSSSGREGGRRRLCSATCTMARWPSVTVPRRWPRSSRRSTTRKGQGVWGWGRKGHRTSRMEVQRAPKWLFARLCTDFEGHVACCV